MRKLSMIARVYELVTGKPYWTTRYMSAEFGLPPAVEFASELEKYTDLELLAYGEVIVAELRAQKRARSAVSRRTAGVR
jgi:hypothetical protein